MKKILIFVILLGLTVFTFAERVTVLTELSKPTSLIVDNERVFITEGSSVFVYSAKDYQFIKKFGKAGDGPQEFNTAGGQLPIRLYARSQDLVVNSFGKVSFFSKDGAFIKEIKNKSGISFYFWPVEENYIGMSVSGEEGIRYNALNLFDAELKKIKQIYKTKADAQQSGKIKVLSTSLNYYTLKDKIFVSSKPDFIIEVLDKDGNSLFNITRDFKRPKFTDKDKSDLIETIKATPQGRAQYEMIKSRLEYPTVYPAIATFVISDDIVYIITFNRQGKSFEFFIYDIKGKFIKTLFVPFYMTGPLAAYPLWIKNNKVYQLVENEDDEIWELHINEIK